MKVALPRYFSLTKIVSVIVRSVVVFCHRTDPKFTINLRGGGLWFFCFVQNFVFGQHMS